MTNDQYPMTTDMILVRTPTGGYDVLVGPGLLSQVGELVLERGLRGLALVVSDETVAGLYAERVIKALSAAGLEADLVTFPAGEPHKTLRTVEKLYGRLLRAGAGRGATIVALGGGVVGDTAGFLAATYMRGLTLVHAPTTLLAMVDSSIGGKVGVDLPEGKNLVGAFHQPRLVVADTGTLKTLPADQFVAGLAEVVKAAVIGDPDLFDHLESQGWEPIAWVIQRAIAVKVAVVEEDPHESGHRAVLNLGHTFAHALEVLSDYVLPHGHAVSVGMVIAARVAVEVGLCRPSLERRIGGLLAGLGLPVTWAGADPEAVLAAMAHDKKRRAGRLRFVLPVRLGQVVVTDDVPQNLILRALHETWATEARPRPDDPIWRLPEVGKSIGGTGLGDAARNHDRHVYDEDKPL